MLSINEYINKVYIEFMHYMKYFKDKGKLDKWFYEAEQQYALRESYDLAIKDYKNGVANAFEDGAAYAFYMMYE